VKEPSQLSHQTQPHYDFGFILYRLDSKLIILLGAREEDDPNGIHYYKFDRNRFVHLRSVDRPKEEP